MEKVLEYRSFASALRREAASLALDRARNVKLAAAERWETLADELEAILAPKHKQASRDWIF